MSEPTVEVPVSLIERAIHRLIHNTKDASKVVDELRALLSQPTPSAETIRVDYMAPGTTFVCGGAGVPNVEHDMLVTVHARPDGTRILWCRTHRFGADSHYVDESTIRDITPPKKD